jgi:2-polyprenyl-3-methyl-5-hydroxy-6-metoxy-1,4-benzoquinol methylase
MCAVIKERTDAPQDKNPVARYEHLMRYEFVVRESGKKVLDVGCGYGYGSKMLHDSGRDVTSIDVSPEAIEYARKKYPGPNYIVTDGNTLPFDDGTFDSVVAFEVLEHMPDPERFVPEARRVLKPGGTLFISTPNPRHLINAVKHAIFRGPWPEKLEKNNKFHLKEYHYDEFVSLLERNNFKVENIFGQTLFWSRPLFWASRILFPRILGRLIVTSGTRFPRFAATVVAKAGKE